MAGWTAEEDEKLKRWFAEGLSAGVMSTRFQNRTRNSVIGRLTRLGLKRGNQGKPSVDDIAWLRCDLGWAECSIAQALGCELAYVERVVRDYTSPAGSP